MLLRIRRCMQRKTLVKPVELEHVNKIFGTPEEQAEAHHQLGGLKLSFNDIERLHVSKDTIAVNTADNALSDIQKLLDQQLCSLTSSYTTKKWPIPLLNAQENMDEDKEDLNNDSDAVLDNNMDQQMQLGS